MLQKYGKAFAAVAFAVVTALQATLSDGNLSTQEQVQIAIALVTAIGVWLVPITPQYGWMKTAVAALLAVLNVLATLIIGGISPADIAELVLAALTVLTVGAAPAQSDTGTPAVRSNLRA